MRTCKVDRKVIAGWRMRIGELINTLEMGGAERVMVNLTIALKKRGHEVFVFCLRAGGALQSALEIAGIQVFVLGKKDGPEFGPLKNLATLLRTLQIEVLHSHNPIVHHYAVVASMMAKQCVLVNTLHGPSNLGRPVRLKEALYWLASKRTNAIVVICESAYKYFENHGAVPTKKLVTIENGINTSSFSGHSHAAVLQKSSPTVLGTVGRLAPVKDHRGLLHAVATLLSSGIKCELRILGDGPLREELQKLARDLEVQGNVLFLGQSDEVSRFMNQIDIFVLCSKSEGLSMALLEAMASSKPCVVTDVGDSGSLVRKVNCGWICQPSSLEDLVSALRLACESNEQERIQMGNRARQLVEECFSIEQMAIKHELLFDKLLVSH